MKFHCTISNYTRDVLQLKIDIFSLKTRGYELKKIVSRKYERKVEN